MTKKPRVTSRTNVNDGVASEAPRRSRSLRWPPLASTERLLNSLWNEIALQQLLRDRAATLRLTMARVEVEEARRGLQGYCDALIAVAELLPALGTTWLEHHQAQAMLLVPNSSLRGEPSASFLIEVGWLAWRLGEESQALTILGGVGGMVEGDMGRAMMQASTYLHAQRIENAAAILTDAVSRYDDTKGEASATLAMLWLLMDDSRWIELARQVIVMPVHTEARELCVQVLASRGRVRSISLAGHGAWTWARKFSSSPDDCGIIVQCP